MTTVGPEQGRANGPARKLYTMQYPMDDVKQVLEFEEVSEKDAIRQKESSQK